MRAPDGGTSGTGNTFALEITGAAGAIMASVTCRRHPSPAPHLTVIQASLSLRAFKTLLNAPPAAGGFSRSSGLNRLRGKHGIKAKLLRI